MSVTVSPCENNDAVAFMDRSSFHSDDFSIVYFYVSVTANWCIYKSLPFFFLGLMILVCTYEELQTFF